MSLIPCRPDCEYCRGAGHFHWEVGADDTAFVAEITTLPDLDGWTEIGHLSEDLWGTSDEGGWTGNAHYGENLAMVHDFDGWAEGGTIHINPRRAGKVSRGMTADFVYFDEAHDFFYPPTDAPLPPEITAEGSKEYLQAQRRANSLTPWQRSQVGPKALEALFGWSEQTVLLNRLNRRWHGHWHPDYFTAPTPEDPNYYLRNPS